MQMVRGAVEAVEALDGALKKQQTQQQVKLHSCWGRNGCQFGYSLPVKSPLTAMLRVTSAILQARGTVGQM